MKEWRIPGRTFAAVYALIMNEIHLYGSNINFELNNALEG
jgi:hypothetical protein